MKKRIIGMLLVAMLTTAGAVSAQDSPFAPENFSATVYLTTDYVSRGISFSGEDPALQATFDYAHPTGLFAGIWASSWDSPEDDNSLETGYYAGYAGAIGKVGYSLSANYYAYPGANDFYFDENGRQSLPEFDYWEFMASANYCLAQAPLAPTLGVGYVYSPDWFGEDGDLNYTNATVDLALPANFGLGFEAGYFDLEGDKFTGAPFGLDGGDGYDYVHYRASIYTTLVGFGLDLSYHDTTEEDYMGGLGGSRVVFTLSRSL